MACHNVPYLEATMRGRTRIQDDFEAFSVHPPFLNGQAQLKRMEERKQVRRPVDLSGGKAAVFFEILNHPNDEL